MSKQLLFSLIYLALIGCAGVTPEVATEYQMCPMADPVAWALIQGKVEGADEMISLAKPDLKAPFPDDRVQLIWFEGKNGNILLCRTIVSRSNEPGSGGCGSSSWKFFRGSGKWDLTEDGETVVFCH